MCTCMGACARLISKGEKRKLTLIMLRYEFTITHLRACECKVCVCVLCMPHATVCESVYLGGPCRSLEL
jgi:hypothetical protein